MDGFVDPTGLCAVAGHPDAGTLAAAGLAALRHRGDRGAVAVADGATVRFAGDPNRTRLDAMPGGVAIAAASGGDDGPRMVFVRPRGGALAAAVAGRFTNGARLRRELLDAGAVFAGPTDAELLVHLIAASHHKTFVNRLVEALWRVEGAYTLLVAVSDRVVAVRDPGGFRPLVLGRLGDATIVASEDGAVRVIGGEVRREVRAGELVVLDARGAAQSVNPFPARPPSACVQELIAVARDDAAPFGRSVAGIRRLLGERLGTSLPRPDADVVCAVPGAELAALGYARATGVPYEAAIAAEPPTGPVPEPAASIRDFGARLAWRIVPSLVHGRSVALVASGLGTGRSLRKLVRLLREAGARAVHLRIAAPPVRASCPYGLVGPLTEELVMSRVGVHAAEVIGVTSVELLALDALHDVAGTGDAEVHGLCDACLSGRRPVEPERADDQLPLF
ncbi:MAG: hypothetical protein ABMB14_00155 [Myxococcota bacterium]